MPFRSVAGFKPALQLAKSIILKIKPTLKSCLSFFILIIPAPPTSGPYIHIYIMPWRVSIKAMQYSVYRGEVVTKMLERYLNSTVLVFS